MYPVACAVKENLLLQSVVWTSKEHRQFHEFWGFLGVKIDVGSRRVFAPPAPGQTWNSELMQRLVPGAQEHKIAAWAVLSAKVGRLQKNVRESAV